jgi:uncharacterized protein (TIGR02246 family)
VATEREPTHNLTERESPLTKRSQMSNLSDASAPYCLNQAKKRQKEKTIMATLATLEPQEVERYARSFEALFYQGDFTTMASYYTEDAQIMNEGQEIIRGREAIEQFWQVVCQMAGKVKRTIEIQEIESSGDIGYVRSRVTTHMQVTEDQEMTTIFKDITIWKQGTDGTWQVAVDISNHDPAPRDHADLAVR